MARDHFQYQFKPITRNKRPEIPLQQESRLLEFINIALNKSQEFANSVKDFSETKEIRRRERPYRASLNLKSGGNHAVRKLLQGTFFLGVFFHLRQPHQLALRYAAMSQRYLMEAYLWLPVSARRAVILGVEVNSITRGDWITSWRGIVAVSRLAYGFRLAEIQSFYPNPEADLYSKIDLMAEMGKQSKTHLVFQVKAAPNTKMEVILSRPNRGPNETEFRVAQGLWNGVKDLNHYEDRIYKEPRIYIPVLAYVWLNEQPLAICEDCPSIRQAVLDLRNEYNT